MEVLGTTFTTAIDCDAEIVESWDEAAPYLLSFEDGGVGSASFPTQRTHARFREGCGCDHNKQSIETIVENCEYDSACGMCSCDFGYEASAVYDKKWTRDESKLDLGSVFGGDYCVKGETLQVGGYTFEKVSLVGVPKVCVARDLDRCEGAGCHVGECVGDTKCGSAATSSACNTLQGCSWNQDACAGDSTSKCEITDWGVVHGCEIVTDPVRCEGVAPACDEGPLPDCKTVPGCYFGACTGVPAVSCEDFYPPDCGAQAEGCEDTGEARCTGALTCGAQRDGGLCYDLGCDWDGMACAGTPPKCEGLDPAGCMELSYCEVVIGSP